MKDSQAFRPEIQGLRAIAVLAVLAFHLWPAALPGGYVGVDVFFVISGYLITGLLLKEYEAAGTISVARFYRRRIRRLLPAATLVLIAVTAGVALLPASRWEDVARDIAASALYGQNWWLAHQAVDYLASENAPSPLQHFWSLSVEEQYYIVWPLLILAATHLTGWTARHPRKAFGVFVAIIAASSLTYSVYLTPRSSGVAYFATTTRAWELALGGALTVWQGWQSWPRRVCVAAGYVGIAMIGWSICAYTISTPFPGYAAALPTLGAGLVIISGQAPGTLGITTILASRPAQLIGDLSYSLYLWHWPIIVFYKARYGDQIPLMGALLILGASFGLAYVSKRWVEDRFRAEPRKPGRVFGRAWALATLCISLSVLLALSVYALAQQPSGSGDLAATRDEANYPGARMLTDHVTPADPTAPYLPRPTDAKKDEPLAYKDRCITSVTKDDVMECRYGNPDKKAFRMLVVGDSHAVHWLPPLREIANQQHWNMRVIVKSACAFADVHPEDFEDDQTRFCASWNQKVLKRIAIYKPDLIVVSQSIGSLSHLVKGSSAKSKEALVSAMLSAWAKAAGTHGFIAAIKDTPRPGRNVPDCLSTPGATINGCAQSRKKALDHWDPLEVAAARMDNAQLINLDDAICGEFTCEPVVGNILVWRDSHHMTASFAKTLAPALAKRLVPMVEARTGAKGEAFAAPAQAPAFNIEGVEKPIYDRVVRSKSGLYFRRQVYALRSTSIERAETAAEAGLGKGGYQNGEFRSVPSGAVARFSGEGLPFANVKITALTAPRKSIPAGTRFLVYVSWRVSPR
ncbi:acyltransferase family protein [Dyella sp.]|jgi:peptidoglycan/LPS O-acetylase OafA/YrhL|uniref:acyltransferase family protein n=1 Tax=Dyella sp. TaxID=1869338 RepID=UPI002D78CA63|nr:acyltransferase family protein [Dyella sp.]HET6430812.1 acyltransferase family protein [Dyella sp.]